MRRCYGCMHEFADEFELCPHCGFIVGTAPEIKSHLPCGTKLSGGRYILGKVLGHGGFGITYIAWDSKRNRPVAIKEFFPNALSTRSEGESIVSCYNSKSEKFFKDGVRKMLDEGERLSKFYKNENIVNVYDYFEANKTAYIVMEYLEGKDLKKYLEENGGKLDIDEAIEIILPVLNALNDMHRENLIHRDISPDNIFICNNGKVKILDFGSARLAVQDADKSMSIMLKKGYAPKEQYSSRSKQGPWTDVYAVSATLYELVTGHKPVDSMERDEVPVKSFKELGVLGRGELESIILKGMAPDVADRTPDAATLYAQLAEIIKPADGSKPDFIPKPPKAFSNENKKTKSKKIYIIAAVIAVVIIAGAVGGKFAWNRFAAKPSETTTVPPKTTESTTQAATEAPLVTDAISCQFTNGETTLTEKLNSIIGKNENVYMADINGDGIGEIIIKKETDAVDETGNKVTEISAYTILPDGTIKENRLNFKADARMIADSVNKQLVIVEKTLEGKNKCSKLKVTDAGFVLEEETEIEGEYITPENSAPVNESNSEEKPVKAVVDIEELNVGGECGTQAKWTYYKGGSLLRISGNGAMKKYSAAEAAPWIDDELIAAEVKYLIIGDEITHLRNNAFNGLKALQEAYIGKAVTTIDDYVFAECSSLKSLDFSDSVEEIGSNVILNSGVTEIKLGEMLNSVVGGSFVSSNLAKISMYDKKNAPIDENDDFCIDEKGVLYSRNLETLYCYPAAKTDTVYNIDTKTKTVMPYAFMNARISDTVTFHSGISTVGESAFKGSAIKTLALPDSVVRIEKETFNGCPNLETAILGNGVSVIGERAFGGCSNLKKLQFPESSLKTIGNEAFYGCSSLPAVTVPESVEEMGNSVFADCSKLEQIKVDKKKSECTDWEGWSSGVSESIIKYEEENNGILFPNWRS